MRASGPLKGRGEEAHSMRSDDPLSPSHYPLLHAPSPAASLATSPARGEVKRRTRCALTIPYPLVTIPFFMPLTRRFVSDLGEEAHSCALTIPYPLITIPFCKL